ncbi:MAG TPA: DUF4232 domain-containing protein [Streptosporangiaceae bacterium]|nr:DUF4232 domain-containing protein [Streptosporangiaceae bacterium]
MNFTVLGGRRLLIVATLGAVAALAAGCGTASSGGSPNSTVTVTVTPSSGTSSSSTPAPPASSSSSAPAGPAECATSALKVKVGSSNGAAGTIYYSIDFTNVSAASCFVEGYPGASLVSAGNNSGSQIGADAKRDPVVTPKEIVLAPGQTANAQLGVAEAGNFPAGTCQPVTVHWLKVFPPDQTVAAYTPFTTQTCASTSVATMHIAALTAGA